MRCIIHSALDLLHGYLLMNAIVCHVFADQLAQFLRVKLSSFPEGRNALFQGRMGHEQPFQSAAWRA